MRVAICQSNYLPWKGYFDLIKNVDLFLFHDDVQYTKQDWRNRNRIKTKQGLRWLTIPCGSKENRHVCDVQLPNNGWQEHHWNIIRDAYGKALYFSYYEDFFSTIFRMSWGTLSELNQFLIRAICSFLQIQTRFDDSRQYALISAKGERVLELLTKVGATTYVSGPKGKSYLDPAQFQQKGIQLEWMDYSDYLEYPQLHGPFVHDVSIIDLLFNQGPQATMFLKPGSSTLNRIGFESCDL